MACEQTYLKASNTGDIEQLMGRLAHMAAMLLTCLAGIAWLLNAPR